MASMDVLHHHDAIRADQSIRFCTKCKKCWEKIDLTNIRYIAKGKGYTYYENFPSFGKQKTTCAKCSGKTVIKNKLQDFILYLVK
tara:strand:- start:227 stop:481 length:255 start_codon:yes stop_codon:yes gene_type:complete